MIEGVRGMRMLADAQARRWRMIEQQAFATLLSFGYEEVQLPLIERTALFSRGMGETTDVVTREMYAWEDRDGSEIALRPEGTAGCVRALSDAGKLYNQTQRVFYAGPMFRHERPQLGRYRQFYQIGAEAFGFAGPDVDAELIHLTALIWQQLGIADRVTLQLNTLGSSASRAAYRDALIAYLTPLKAQLDDDSQRRLQTNPLRILDSKIESTQALLSEAPLLPDFLDEAGREHFDALQALLTELNVPYEVNPGLVRGLDYYTHTVFEWTTDALGAQGTICGGGRYDGLVETLGGRPTPAAGFGIGIDRVELLVEQVADPAQFDRAADVYVCIQQNALTGWAQLLSHQLRQAIPGLRVRVNAGGGKLKAQFKRADASGAEWAVLVGEQEAADGQVVLKPLRTDGAQTTCTIEEAVQKLSPVA